MAKAAAAQAQPKKPRTIEEAIRPPSKPKSTWEWHSHLDNPTFSKNDWHPTKYPEGDICLPRIKKLDDVTYLCYRNSSYLGSQRTLEDAKQMCFIGKKSQLDFDVKKWEAEHPGEIPPFLTLTDSERKAWQHHNPPKPGQQNRGAETREKWGGPKVNEDPATRRLREQLAMSSGKGARAAKKAEQASLSGVLVRVKPGNPKKPGSAPHGRWALMFEHADKGSTVTQFLAAKGNPTTLENAIKAGWVRLEQGGE